MNMYIPSAEVNFKEDSKTLKPLFTDLSDWAPNSQARNLKMAAKAPLLVKSDHVKLPQSLQTLWEKYDPYENQDATGQGSCCSFLGILLFFLMKSILSVWCTKELTKQLIRDANKLS